MQNIPTCQGGGQVRGSDVLDLRDQPSNRGDTMETGTALSPVSSGQNHLALICGLPSSLTYFVADLCRDLLVRSNGACEVVVINELGAETVERIKAVSNPILFLTEVPNAAVAEFVRDARFPILLIGQSFSMASLDFMAARDAALPDTARTMARAQIGLDALGKIPRTTVLDIQTDEQLSPLIERIAAILTIPPGIVHSMVANRDLDKPLAQLLEEIIAYETLPPDEDVKAVLNKLDGFYGYRSIDRMKVLDVPMATLLEATPPHLSATNPIEFLGTARCLTFGPYLHLPKGRWRARFTFHSSENQTTNTIGFDIAIDQEIKVDCSFELEASGKFAFDCEFEVHDPYSPLEFRTFLRRGSIGGKLVPLSLMLQCCNSETNSNHSLMRVHALQ